MNILIAAGFFCFAAHISFAQNITSTGNPLAASGAVTFKEKLYVHTDKSFYMPGEIVWFKVYCIDAATNRLAGISKVASIEILDRQNKPVQQAKIALKNGLGSGSFLIPANVSTATYLLRAYTNWMLNFGPDFYFHKQLTIVNAAKRPDWQAVTKAAAADVQFFPEGGDLVNGIESKVAFRAVDQQGKGMDCRGYIISQKKDTVARFRPLHFGIGSFKFMPAAGNSYTAILELENGGTYSTPLPKALEQGYAMHTEDADIVHVLVSVLTNTGESGFRSYLVVQSGQKAATFTEAKAVGNKTTFIIDKKTLSEGISTFTFLNSDHLPMCERLYFKRPADKQPSFVSISQQTFGQRNKVIATIQMPGDTSNAQQHLSMSVYLIDSLQQPDELDIASYFQLSSELKGTVESPSWYLTDTTAEAVEAADNLMLTHGWRKITHADNTLKTKPSYSPEYEGQLVKAKVSNKQTGLPVANVVTYFSVPGEKFTFANALSNADGEVSYSVKDFYGSVQAVLQTSLQDSNYTVTVPNPFSGEFLQDSLPLLNLPEKWKEQLTTHYIGSQVQSTFATEGLQKFILPSSTDTTAFFGTPDKKYFLDDYTRFPTMEEVLHEYVAGVVVRKQGQNYRINVLNLPYLSNFEQPPLVLLDGVPVFDINKIIAFDPLKVKKLEVTERKYYLGNLVNSGILSYTTYNGDLGGYELDPNAVVADLQGMQIERVFFSPVYDNAQKVQSPVADSRNVLLWSPDIEISGGETKAVTFYTSDLPGNYAISVQGISSNGHPLTERKIISVKQ